MLVSRKHGQPILLGFHMFPCSRGGPGETRHGSDSSNGPDGSDGVPLQGAELGVLCPQKDFLLIICIEHVDRTTIVSMD